MTYWENEGRHQLLADRLQKLIPLEGACPDAEGRNRHLDRFRRAANCYYDLYNNGLCNRADEFFTLFGFGAGPNAKKIGNDEFEFKVDALMDAFVLTAAKEQGIKEV